MKIDVTNDASLGESPGFSTSAHRRAPGGRLQRLWSAVRRAPLWKVVAGCLVVAAAGAAAVTFAVGRGGHDAAAGVAREAPPVVTVTVAKAHIAPIKSRVVVSGTVSPWDPLSVGAEINGLRIESVRVDDGDFVKKGQILATLNASVLEASLAEARARLAASQANVAKALQPNRPEELSSWRAALAQAEANVAQDEAALVQAHANLSNAVQNVKRYRDLAKQGAVSAQDAENRETSAQTGEAQVRAAEQRIRAGRFAVEQTKQKLQMAEIGGRSEDIAVSRAQLAEARATVERLAAQVAQTVIKAPDDGLITERLAHIGDITAMNKTLFSMARSNRLELRALVPEADLAKIKTGEAATISTPHGAGPSVQGQVRQVNPLVDSNTRLGTVEIDVPNGAGFRPGMFVKGEVDLGLRNVLVVPAKAVLTRESNNLVLVLEGNKARVRHVVTGSRSGDLIQIVSGVSDGDTVIVSGAGFLKDGDVVRQTP